MEFTLRGKSNQHGEGGVAADARTRYSTVEDLLIQLRNAGFDTVGLLTSGRHPQGRSDVIFQGLRVRLGRR